jgi:hypothetical protein
MPITVEFPTEDFSPGGGKLLNWWRCRWCMEFRWGAAKALPKVSLVLPAKAASAAPVPSRAREMMLKEFPREMALSVMASLLGLASAVMERKGRCAGKGRKL